MAEAALEQYPLPPPHLRERVSGNTDPDTFRRVGSSAASRLLGIIAMTAAPEVLDWGCGPGRVAAHLTGVAGVSLHGCDPDAEAVAWCNEHLVPGRFAVSGLYPPLPYPDGSFDVVLAISVMTHLRRRTQLKWLAELARVLRPDGVLIATVHGRPAARGFGVADFSGIQDHYLDPFMADVLPADYYHTVLQTPEYTREAWSGWFDIVAYEEGGLELHDLVTCCRKML